MRHPHQQRLGRMRRIAGATLGAAAFVPLSVAAQSANDWKLPEGTSTATPAPAPVGPVDPDNPFTRPSPAPTASADAPPAPTVRPAPAPSPKVTLPAAVQPERRPEPRREQPSPPEAAASTAVPPEGSPPPGVATPPAEPLSGAEPAAPPADTPAAPPADDSDPIPWTLLGGGAAFVLLVAAAFAAFRRRKNARPGQVHEAPPQAEPPATQPSPPARVGPVGTNQEAKPAVAAVARCEAMGLDFELVPSFLRISLVFATLGYTLRLSNPGDADSIPLVLHGDLASAHSGADRRGQIAPHRSTLSMLHQVPAIAPGQSVDVKGELRLPLSAIVPIGQGGMEFMVPLIRFALLPARGEGVRRTFMLGLAEASMDHVSIRIDSKSADYRALAIREVEAARAFPLAPAGTIGLPLDRVRAAG
jgi:hypothetical protein